MTDLVNFYANDNRLPLKIILTGEALWVIYWIVLMFIFQLVNLDGGTFLRDALIKAIFHSTAPLTVVTTVTSRRFMWSVSIWVFLVIFTDLFSVLDTQLHYDPATGAGSLAAIQSLPIIAVIFSGLSFIFYVKVLLQQPPKRKILK